MSSTIPLPPREGLCNRSCSNKHTHMETFCRRADNFKVYGPSQKFPGCPRNREKPGPAPNFEVQSPRVHHARVKIQSDSWTTCIVVCWSSEGELLCHLDDLRSIVTHLADSFMGLPDAHAIRKSLTAKSKVLLPVSEFTPDPQRFLASFEFTP